MRGSELFHAPIKSTFSFIPNEMRPVHSCCLPKRARSPLHQQQRHSCSSPCSVGCPHLVWSNRRPRCTSLQLDISAASPATSTSQTDRQQGGQAGSKVQRVVVLGGTGRVGGSTAEALLAGGSAANLHVLVAGRSEDRYHKATKRRPRLAGADFLNCDIDDADSLKAAIDGADLVVHAAGPFQRKEHCLVLETAIEARIPYVDVCDDVEYSEQTKKLHQKAVDRGVPCITTAGIYPGVSNLMAAHMIALARQEYDAEWHTAGSSPSNGSSSSVDNKGADRPPPRGEPVEPTRVRYFYYTAGSGGVGPTILETSLLLAGTEVIAYKDGKQVKAPPISNREVVDFGLALGGGHAYLYNLPEVASTHKYLNVPSVSARFSTAPEFWNWTMWLIARLAPKGFLADRNKSKALAQLSMPWVRFVDPFVGEKVGMLVEVELSDGSIASGLFVHKLLSDSVGICVAAFAQEVLSGGTQPGVWFPEEGGAVRDRRALLKASAAGCDRFELNRPPWALSGDPIQIGMGFYW